jgi:hypothetical protein
VERRREEVKEEKGGTSGTRSGTGPSGPLDLLVLVLLNLNLED